MKSIETKFGTIYIDEWLSDYYDDTYYRVEDRITIYDTPV